MPIYQGQVKNTGGTVIRTVTCKAEDNPAAKDMLTRALDSGEELGSVVKIADAEDEAGDGE